VKEVLAADLEGLGPRRDQLAADLAVATGGRPVLAAAGDRLDQVKPCNFGRARLAWVRKNQSAIIGGRGSLGGVRSRIAEARAALSAAGDPADQQEIRKRIGRLGGATAIVMVGGRTETERSGLKLRVEAAIRVARAAARGTVPGGGAALVRAGAAIRHEDLKDLPAFIGHAFVKALQEPMRQMARNAGVDPAVLVAEAGSRPDETFDFVDRAWKPAGAGAVADALDVVIGALQIAVGAAAAAISTAAIVHGPRPAVSVDP
jgi:chaperonin GroEL